MTDITCGFHQEETWTHYCFYWISWAHFQVFFKVFSFLCGGLLNLVSGEHFGRKLFIRRHRVTHIAAMRIGTHEAVGSLSPSIADVSRLTRDNGWVWPLTSDFQYPPEYTGQTPQCFNGVVTKRILLLFLGDNESHAGGAGRGRA